MTSLEKETSLKDLEADLWATADSLRNESSLTAQDYYMPVLGLIFLRHATYRFRKVEAETMSWGFGLKTKEGPLRLPSQSAGRCGRVQGG